MARASSPQTASGTRATASRKTSTPLNSIIWPKKANRDRRCPVPCQLPGRRGRRDVETVLDHAHALARQAPFGIAIGKEAARRDKVIAEAEHGADEPLAAQETRRADFGKALVAVDRRRARAQRAGVALHHLAVMVAERQVFVERQHDARIGQRVAHRVDRLEAESDDVVEVDDVRPAHAHVAQQVAVDFVRPAVRQHEMVVAVGVKLDLVGAEAEAHQRRGLVPGHRRADPRKVARGNAVDRVQSLVQVVRGDLGAAQRPVGMAVGYDEHTERICCHCPLTG